MNKKKIIIIILCVLFSVTAIGTYIYLTKEDKNTSLNMIEKKWIENNKKKLLDISIFNDVPALNYHGSGVVFDFLESLENETGLEFNKISYNIGSDIKSDLAFKQKDNIEENDVVLYQDNYVLVTKDGSLYNSPNEMKNITIGVLNENLDKVNSYLLGADVTFRTFENAKSLLEAFETDKTLAAITLPKLQYLENILSNENYKIGYNITEYKSNYVLSLSNNSNYNTLNSILTKYYKKWSEANLNTNFNKYLVSSYFNFTGEESQNNAKFHSKRYVYGFTANKPYDAMSDGQLVGINSSIISDFTSKSNVVVEYKEYKNYDELINGFNANEFDFFLETGSNVDYKMDVYKTISPFTEELVILTNNSKDIIVNSVNSLLDYTVGVIKGSKLSSYLSKYNIKLKEFNDIDELMNNNKLDVIAIDNYNYLYYVQKGIKKYTKAYNVLLDNDYSYVFRDIADNEQFENIFNFYLEINPISSNINNGIKSSININVISSLIKYVLSAIGIIVAIVIVVVAYFKIKHKSKKKTVNLSKGDKLKYIDCLTSLKNRNYLNDHIELWDESEVYPQTIIIVDLNDIAYINDNYGHAEGDLVIKEAANILINNQLANSEIIRTNGNEFLIYLVSYEEKQVISYIRKLNKEFKELVHGFGAAIGYSIINDAIKTIDDAVNEATLDMRNNKEEASKD